MLKSLSLISFLILWGTSLNAFAAFGDGRVEGGMQSLLPPNYQHSLEDKAHEVRPFEEQEERPVHAEYRDQIEAQQRIKEESDRILQEHMDALLAREESLNAFANPSTLGGSDGQDMVDFQADSFPENNPFAGKKEGNRIQEQLAFREISMPSAAGTGNLYDDRRVDPHEEALFDAYQGPQNPNLQASIFSTSEVALPIAPAPQMAPKGKNFSMVSLGIEGGPVFPYHAYRSALGNGIDATYGGVEAALGLRATWEKFFPNHWVLGLTGAARQYLGDVTGHHTTFTSTGQSYKAEPTQRYEISGTVGKWVGSLYPYLKIGPIVSQLGVQVSDLDSSFTSSTRQWVWGGTVGGGLETQLTKSLILGGSLEYDRYLMIKNSLFDANNGPAGYKLTPSVMNLMVTLRYRFDRLF